MEAVNPRLEGWVRHSAGIPPSVTFGYCQRRHWIEVIPELIKSSMLAATFLAFWLHLPSYMFVSPFNQAGHVIYAMAWTVAIMTALVWWFGVEVLRWWYDIYYATDHGWGHFYLDLRPGRYNISSQQREYIHTVKTEIPILYRLLMLNVGYIYSSGLGDVKEEVTPLIRYPDLLASILVHEAVPGHGKAGGEPLPWRE